jgi:hypothetical protein
MYCVTKFLTILVLVLRFYLCTLYKYSQIAYYELITFPCINPTYVSFMYCTYKISIIITCTVLSKIILYCTYCYYNDKFYIHFGGSLEY